MSEYPFLYSKINELQDDYLIALIEEIHSLRKEKIEGRIIQFLILSMHTNCQRTPGIKKRFDSNEVRATVYLYKKIGELHNTGIYSLLLELVALDNKRQLYPEQYKSLEDYHKTAVYSLLNKFIPDKNKKQQKRKL